MLAHQFKLSVDVAHQSVKFRRRHARVHEFGQVMEDAVGADQVVVIRVQILDQRVQKKVLPTPEFVRHTQQFAVVFHSPQVLERVACVRFDARMWRLVAGLFGGNWRLVGWLMVRSLGRNWRLV